MAPDGRVVYIAAEQAVEGRGRGELHFFAAVVAAGEAGLAFVADDVRFDGDAVAHLEGRDRGVHGQDHAGGFVAENVRVFYDHGADAAGVPEVHVGSGRLVLVLRMTERVGGGPLTRICRCF